MTACSICHSETLPNVMMDNQGTQPLPQHMPLSSRFEIERSRLLGMAQRMLGSAVEAEDVVQDAWIRFQTSHMNNIDNAGAWLTTVVSRLAIDRLRMRANRPEEAIDPATLTQLAEQHGYCDPEQELMLADSIGIALLVVLDRLRPSERVAFVLHDLFGMPFQEIAAVLDCSPDAARQLASRARRSVRGVNEEEAISQDTRKHSLVSAFFAASRSGDVAALLRVLDADVTLMIDPALAATDRPLTVRGARKVAEQARLGAAQQLAARLMLVNGEPGIVVAPAGRLRMVMTFVIDENAINGIEIVANQQRLATFTLTIVEI